MAFNLKNVPSKTTFTKKNQQATQSQLKISCVVNRFIYKDEESGFFVFAAELSDNQPNVNVQVDGKPFMGRKFAVVGNSLLMVQTVVERQEVEVFGHFEAGKSPGTIQFTAESLMEKIPTKPKAIEIFLGSGKIYGIGPKTAKKIVNKFGAHTIDILDKEPDTLLDVEGINEKKLQTIKQSWQEWRSIYEIISTMMVYGVGDIAGVRIFNHFKEKSIYVIKNEPYSLTDVPSIGFKTADKIAQSLGLSPVDPNRIEKCLMYTMEEISEKGHTAYPKDDLLHKANETLCVDPELVSEAIQRLIEKELLIIKNVKMKIVRDRTKNIVTVVEKEGVAHKKIHHTEVRIAKELKRIMDFPLLEDAVISRQKINEFLNKNEGKLDDSQLEAAKTILFNKVSILTGGPGTGKTHTIKSLLKYFDNAVDLTLKNENPLSETKLKSVLCAPTGRAAKRMEELTQKSASTIHRLLGFKEGQFTHNENNKLKGDVFIIDESSMNDIWIQNALLKAIPSHARVIFVGDVDQLPSVGAGNVLRDMIDSGLIPVCRLSAIHRQALNSQIIVASHAIVNNKVPELHNINSNSDFVFIESDSNENIHQSILDVVSTLISKGVSQDDIQILTPKKETEVGTHNLNSSLRGVLNPLFLQEHERKTRFIPGDRVMQFKNNRDLDIFNGDVGIVKDIDDESSITSVKFDDKMVHMSSKEQNELNLSYAITIHKSQGSDYPYVIIPMSKSHTYMWDANLLYTAVTRGKTRVILVGDKKTLFFSVSQFKQNDRITGLKEEIIKVFNEPAENLKNVKISAKPI